MDDARFQSEYKQVCDGLYTFLTRMAKDPERAADILQDAALRAYRSRRKFRGESSFKTWIYRIAINTMKNHYAKAGRARKLTETAQHLGRANTPTPEMILSGREDAARLSQALELLEEAYRAPFLLKHVDGLSYGQISKVLKIEEGTARVRVYRARHALMSLLREV